MSDQIMLSWAESSYGHIVMRKRSRRSSWWKRPGGEKAAEWRARSRVEMCPAGQVGVLAVSSPWGFAAAHSHLYIPHGD